MTKITKGYNVFLNCGRNAFLGMPDAIRKTMAMRDAKMFVVPKALRQGIFDSDIPDKLVSEEMVERYLEITPPVYSLIILDYQSIADEIEQSYVIGNDFSAISASCVVIERLLNKARINLRKHHKVTKKLKSTGWNKSINALKEWGYLDDEFADELSYIYKEIRCRYLHSGEIQDMRQDALRSVTAAYKVMKIFIGFPEDLFDGVTCKDETNPKFLEFYEPYLESNREIIAQTQTEMQISELWNRYVSLLNESKYEEACEQCYEIDKLKPKDYVVFNNWGSTLSLLAKLTKDEKLFEQAHQKLEQAVNIESNKPEVYDNWAGIFIYWSKLKIGTPEYEGLLKQAEGKCLKAESQRKGFSAYRLARIYALRSDKEQCRKWLLTGQEAGTLPERDYAMKESDLDKVKNEPWFKEIKWQVEK